MDNESDGILYRFTLHDFEIAYDHHRPTGRRLDLALRGRVFQHVKTSLKYVEWAEDFDRIVRDAVDDALTEEWGDNPPAR